MKYFLKFLICSFSFFISSAYAVETFNLKPTSFINDSTLSSKVTCDGANISPEMAWSNEPSNKAKSFALVMEDLDAPKKPFYHWIVYNIPKEVRLLPEGEKNLPKGVVMGKNSFGKVEFDGACPPEHAKHRYRFTIYALNNASNLPAGLNGKELLKATRKHVIKKAWIIATYER